MTLNELRSKHPRFFYQKANWTHDGTALKIEFRYLLEPDIPFSSSLVLEPIDSTALAKIDKDTIQNWVFHLGLIESFSYWKTAAPAEIVVEAGFLNEAQLAWWKELLLKGMGEFFYTNQIDFTTPDFVKFSCDQPPSASQSTLQTSNQVTKVPKYLVPLGGGKDSTLIIELLEENALPYDIFLSFPQSPAAEKIAKLSRARQIIELKRQFDFVTLAKLSKSGYLHGHFPFASRLAFEAGMAARLLGHQQILVGNEFSSNEGNVLFHGVTVNHQYSKTFEFEQSFRQYVQRYLSPAPEFLSLLQPIHELQIAGLFAQYPRYHQLFKSCNRNQQQETWCCECAKCLFVFTALFPFLEEKQLVGPIFPKNLFENAALNPLALALLGKDAHKPFECVGTYDETLTAFYLSVVKFRERHPNQALPPLLDFLEKNVLSKEKNLQQTAEKVLCFWNSDHNLPKELEIIVKGAQERLCELYKTKLAPLL